MKVELSVEETIAFGLMLLEVTTATNIVFHVDTSVEIVLNDGTLTEHIPLAIVFVSIAPDFDVNELIANLVDAA